MSDSREANALVAERREQPFLYQWNRRLRHLKGISLRNLDISPPTSRPRGRTVADDEHNLKTPAAVLRQKESRILHQTKSYDQLSRLGVDHATSCDGSTFAHQKSPISGGRPTYNLRRKSTLHWASSDAKSRQSKLESLEVDRLVDTWFSIHHDKISEPLYVSEVVERAMNPSFTFFDLEQIPAQLTRSDTFVLKVWAKSEVMVEYQVLVHLKVNLQSMHFIGRGLEYFHHPLPDNCVLIHLTDGIYTNLTDMPSGRQPLPSLTTLMKGISGAQATTFDMQLKLSNTDDVLQDVHAVLGRIEADIQEKLKNTPKVEDQLVQIASHRELLRPLRRAVRDEEDAIRQARQAQEAIRISMQRSSELVASVAQVETVAAIELSSLSSLRAERQKNLVNTNELTVGQIRRVCSTLLQIFPVDPIKNRSLHFTLRQVYLPNSNFSDTNRDEITAALGFVAQLICLFSSYLSVSLPYPLEPVGFVASIRDDISASIAQRQFPLQPVSPAYKFEYGVFLVNKDVEFLMNRFGLRVVDIRHTLPNLKYLMFVVTAGNGTAPGRTTGSIRGLLSGLGSAPSISRRASEDSVTSSVNNEKVDEQTETTLLPLRAKGVPYRASTLSQIA